ncbi:MAG: hypothetical protein HFI74_00570 [Lachnospiraceae bacterium]|jgi:hypothetical protein|nr:hypothetical protein [Lachnospiraceae bacterium]
MNYLNTKGPFLLFRDAVNSGIYVDKSIMSKLKDICRNYNDYISAIIEGIRADLQETYPFLKKKKYHSVSQMFWESGESFIFLIDEWDSIFYKDFMTSTDKSCYLSF